MLQAWQVGGLTRVGVCRRMSESHLHRPPARKVWGLDPQVLASLESTFVYNTCCMLISQHSVTYFFLTAFGVNKIITC